MLTRVRLGAGLSESVDVDYAVEPYLGGYDLIHIEGLEPPSTEIHYSEYAMSPGGRYHSHTQGVRSITMRVGLHPSPGGTETVQDMRRKFYRVVPSGRPIDIRLWNNGVYEYRIRGYVEDIEIDHFTQEPELLVTFVCPDPFFIAGGQIELIDQTPGTHIVDYRGDIRAGFAATINIRNTFSNTIHIENRTTGESISVLRDWVAGERFRVDTSPGLRSIYYTDTGGNILGSLLGAVEFTNDWPSLIRGENELRFRSANSHNWDWNIRYDQYFGGF